jgi:hypothetical protein
MKFLKKFSKKTPHQKIIEELQKTPINQPSILFTKIFPKYPIPVIMDAVNELVANNEMDGKFVGNKSWFLFNAGDKLEKIWEELLFGPIDLDKISTEWGDFGSKRVYIALEDYGVGKKMKSPIFTRKGSILILNSFVLQEWNDAVNKFDIDETEVTFDKIIEQINPDYRNYAVDMIKSSTKEGNSELLVGNDMVVRRRGTLPLSMADFINSQLLDVGEELTYLTISEKFGISEEDVSKIILKLIEDKSIENLTNYPVDGLIKKR